MLQCGEELRSEWKVLVTKSATGLWCVATASERRQLGRIAVRPVW